MSDPGATSHDDLMDLASRWAYDPDGRTGSGPAVEVNGTQFTVLESKHDPETGLDAYVFENPDTKELTVAFQGTADGTDVLQDAELVTSRTPAQYEAAVRYVQDVETRLGRVSSVCGNSLGGGEAAYVGLVMPRIVAVTVSPAPVPAAYAGAAAPNVTNYIAPTDPLHRALVAGGLADRVVGRTVWFPGSSFNLAFAGANHVGGDRDESPYDASMGVPFSLFHLDEQLAEGSLGALVDLDVENLRALAAGVRLRRTELVTVTQALLVDMADEVREHGDEVRARTDRVHQRLHRSVAPVFALAREVVERVEQQYRTTVTTSLDRSTVPVPVRYLIRPLIAELSECGGDLTQAMLRVQEQQAQAMVDWLWHLGSEPFVLEAELLCSGLSEQCDRLDEGLAVVGKRWEAFCRSASEVAEAVAQADAGTAAAIAARSCLPKAIPAVVRPWPGGTVPDVGVGGGQLLAQWIVEARQTASGEMIGVLARALASELEPVADALSAAIAVVLTAEVALLALAATARDLADRTSGTALDRTLGVQDDLERFADRMEQVERDFRPKAVEWVDDLTAARRVVLALPDAVDQFRHQLDESFFSDAQIERCLDALRKCRNLVDRSRLTFAEVVHQLDEHDARAIDALADRAAELRQDLAVVDGSLTTMID